MDFQHVITIVLGHCQCMHVPCQHIHAMSVHACTYACRFLCMHASLEGYFLEFVLAEVKSMTHLICFRLVMNYTADRNNTEGTWKGYVYAVLMFVTATIQSLLLQQYFHSIMVLGMRVRTSILGLVYAKVRTQWNICWTEYFTYLLILIVIKKICEWCWQNISNLIRDKHMYL